MDSTNLLLDLKLIVIDYIGPSELGSNKYQLNYKKCMEEYKRNYYYYDNTSVRDYDMGEYNWRILYKYNYNNKSIYDKDGIIVGNLPKNY